MRCIVLLLGLLCVGSLVGCSPYLEDFNYSPHPAVVEVRSTTNSQSPAVVALASVIGVHVADKKLDIPESVELRLRLENNGQETATFDPATMQLTSAHLQPFPPPIIHIGNQDLIQRVTFQRIYPRVYYDDPYWRPYYGYPPYFWYGGVVVIHRR